MSFQDVGKPGAPKPPQRSQLTAQPNIPEGRPSSSLPKTGDPFAQLSDGILQYQVKHENRLSKRAAGRSTRAQQSAGAKSRG